MRVSREWRRASRPAWPPTAPLSPGSTLGARRPLGALRAQSRDPHPVTRHSLQGMRRCSGHGRAARQAAGRWPHDRAVVSSQLSLLAPSRHARLRSSQKAAQIQRSDLTHSPIAADLGRNLAWWSGGHLRHPATVSQAPDHRRSTDLTLHAVAQTSLSTHFSRIRL